MANADRLVAVAGPAKSSKSSQVLRDIVIRQIDAHFKSTLGSVEDIVNTVMALISKESSFNVVASGLIIPIATSPSARDFYNSDPVVKIRQSGTASQIKNLGEGLIALGLMQVMGWNLVRGASVLHKKCLIESSRPDLVDMLCVNAGDSISSKMLGEENLVNAITAGLAVLETKYKASRPKSGGWYAGGGVFGSRLSCSVGAYLGVGRKDLRTGISPESYVADIMPGGRHYRIANGPSSPALMSVARNSRSGAEGPSTNGGSMIATVPGCSEVQG